MHAGVSATASCHCTMNNMARCVHYLGLNCVFVSKELDELSCETCKLINDRTLQTRVSDFLIYVREVTGEEEFKVLIGMESVKLLPFNQQQCSQVDSKTIIKAIVTKHYKWYKVVRLKCMAEIILYSGVLNNPQRLQDLLQPITERVYSYLDSVGRIEYTKCSDTYAKVTVKIDPMYSFPMSDLCIIEDCVISYLEDSRYEYNRSMSLDFYYEVVQSWSFPNPVDETSFVEDRSELYGAIPQSTLNTVDEVSYDKSELVCSAISDSTQHAKTMLPSVADDHQMIPDSIKPFSECCVGVEHGEIVSDPQACDILT